MPPWTTFRKKYILDAADLPNPHAANCMVIEGFDSEPFFDPQTKTQTVRHLLRLAGWDLPLRINNTRTKILERLFGANSEESVGKKIVLIAAMDDSFGDPRIVINIHPFAPPPETPPTPIPRQHATKNPWRLQQATQYGITYTDAPAALPPSVPTTPVNDNAVLGPERAAAILVSLKARGKTWDDLCRHLSMNGLGQFVLGRTPPEAGLKITDAVKSYMAGFGRVVEVKDPAAEAAAIVASWAPKPVERKPAVNTATGKLMPDAEPDDDIPF